MPFSGPNLLYYTQQYIWAKKCLRLRNPPGGCGWYEAAALITRTSHFDIIPVVKVTPLNSGIPLFATIFYLIESRFRAGESDFPESS